jgi:hypothetical protein
MKEKKFLINLIPMILFREGKIIKSDPGVCGVNPSWVIEWKGKEYLLIKRIDNSCPEYPRGATSITYFEIYVKNKNGKWKRWK